MTTIYVCAVVVSDSEWVTAALDSTLWTATKVVIQCCLVVTWLVPHQTDVVSAHIPYTPCNHLPVYSVTYIRNYMRRIHVFLDVTCYLPFWQNGRDRVCATAVKLEWNGWRNKSQYRKLTLEKKLFQPLQHSLVYDFIPHQCKYWAK